MVKKTYKTRISVMWLGVHKFRGPARYRALFIPYNEHASQGEIYLGYTENRGGLLDHQEAMRLVLDNGELFENGKKVAFLMPYAIGLDCNLWYTKR